jgi:cytochrome c peroxidase
MRKVNFASSVLKTVAAVAAVGVVAAGGAFAQQVLGITNGTPKQSAHAAKSTADQRAAYKRPHSIPYPKDNPYSVAKERLGRTLFFDPRLSAANVQSCASCHNPSFAWGDGLPRGVGFGMKTLGRRSPSILNAAWGDIFMWDGRKATLEEQALGPIEADVEMNMPIDKLIARLEGIAEYRQLFADAFPGDGRITAANIGRAIATFERTVVSAKAPFDRWIEGDEKAISESAKRGFATFNGKGRCAQCHSSWRFTDDSFHDIGLASTDIGRGKFLPDIVKMQHAFKTPGLRNIARRGPYMHDGSVADLAAVVEHYNTGGIARPSRADDVLPLGLTEQEKKDLVEFMHTLTSQDPLVASVELPR